MEPHPGPASPLASATANPGAAAAAAAEVREAISLLEKNLPNLPTGSGMHKAVLESLTKLSKEFPASAAVPGVQQTALMGLADKAKKDAMLRQVMSSMQQGGASPGGQPGTPPPPTAAPMGPM